MSQPILSVGWLKGFHDNTRSPTGEVVWKQLAPSKWVVHLSDWDARIEAGIDIAALCLSVEGINVYLDASAKRASGTFCISTRGDRFVVEHHDA